MLKRAAFDRSVRKLSREGYKILLDIFASAPEPVKFEELPYVFRVREHGESKLDSLVIWEYLVLLLDKMFGRFLPVRFMMFGMVGGSGVFVHFAALWVCFRLLGVEFAIAQGIATFVAMNSNFFLNNILTYRDRRLRGTRLVWGLLSFYAICGLGVVGNVNVADIVFDSLNTVTPGYSWAVAGGCRRADQCRVELRRDGLVYPGAVETSRREYCYDFGITAGFNRSLANLGAIRKAPSIVSD